MPSRSSRPPASSRPSWTSTGCRWRPSSWPAAGAGRRAPCRCARRRARGSRAPGVEAVARTSEDRRTLEEAARKFGDLTGGRGSRWRGRVARDAARLHRYGTPKASTTAPATTARRRAARRARARAVAPRDVRRRCARLASARRLSACAVANGDLLLRSHSPLGAPPSTKVARSSRRTSSATFAFPAGATARAKSPTTPQLVDRARRARRTSAWMVAGLPSSTSEPCRLRCGACESPVGARARSGRAR